MKTKCLITTRHHLEVANLKIERTSTVRLLRIHLNDKLNCDSHVHTTFANPLSHSMPHVKVIEKSHSKVKAFIQVYFAIIILVRWLWGLRCRIFSKRAIVYRWNSSQNWEKGSFDDYSFSPLNALVIALLTSIL